MTKGIRTSPAKPIPILLTVRELHHRGIEGDVTKIAFKLDRSRFEPHIASSRVLTDEPLRQRLKSVGLGILSRNTPAVYYRSICSILVEAAWGRQSRAERGIEAVNATGETP